MRPWLKIFYSAFWELTDERHWQDGNIPWVAKELWAKKHGLDPLATDLLHAHIRALDLAFFRWKSDNRPRQDGRPKRGTISNGDAV